MRLLFNMFGRRRTVGLPELLAGQAERAEREAAAGHVVVVMPPLVEVLVRHHLKDPNRTHRFEDIGDGRTVVHWQPHGASWSTSTTR